MRSLPPRRPPSPMEHEQYVTVHLSSRLWATEDPRPWFVLLTDDGYAAHTRTERLGRFGSWRVANLKARHEAEKRGLSAKLFRGNPPPPWEEAERRMGRRHGSAADDSGPLVGAGAGAGGGGHDYAIREAYRAAAADDTPAAWEAYDRVRARAGLKIDAERLEASHRYAMAADPDTDPEEAFERMLEHERLRVRAELHPVPVEDDVPWEQIGGDVNPIDYGGMIGRVHDDLVEVIEFWNIEDSEGVYSAREAGAPWRFRVHTFTPDELSLAYGDPDGEEVVYMVTTKADVEPYTEGHYAQEPPLTRAAFLVDNAGMIGAYWSSTVGDVGWSYDVLPAGEVEWLAEGGIAREEWEAEEERFREEILNEDEDDELEDTEGDLWVSRAEDALRDRDIEPDYYELGGLDSWLIEAGPSIRHPVEGHQDGLFLQMTGEHELDRAGQDIGDTMVFQALEVILDPITRQQHMAILEDGELDTVLDYLAERAVRRCPRCAEERQEERAIVSPGNLACPECGGVGYHAGPDDPESPPGYWEHDCPNCDASGEVECGHEGFCIFPGCREPTMHGFLCARHARPEEIAGVD